MGTTFVSVSEDGDRGASGFWIARRAVTLADRAFCKALHDELRPLAEALGFVWDPAKMDVGFDAKWDRENSVILVVDGEDVGWVQLQPQPDQLTLREIFVVEGWRGRGIGTAVIEELAVQARDAGLPLTLAVLVNNPALALYLRLGFEEERRDAFKVWLRRG